MEQREDAAQPRKSRTEGRVGRRPRAGAAAGVRDARSARSRRAGAIIAVGVVLLVAAVAASLMLGRYPIQPHEALCMLADKVVPLDRFWTDQQEALFFNVRLPRILLAMLIGCALAAAGAAYQGTFQNPLAAPDILGAQQGAAFGAAVAILAGFSAAGVSAVAFAVSMATVFLVLAISGRVKGNRILTVVLAGIMISMLFQAGVSATKLVADPTDQLPAITYWLMGSLTGAKVSDVQMVVGPIAVGSAVLLALRWRLNVLTMGDDEAATMGVNVKLVRVVVMVAATLVVAASVSVSGMISWIGLVIPHIARMLVGPDFRKLMPASMIYGALFLVVVDDIARLATTAEIPIGILTAFVGAPFFLYLIMQGRRA